jgi:Tfp pilus assembly protein PilO
MAFDYKTQYHQYKRYFLKIRSLTDQPVAKISLALIAALLAVSFFALFAIKPTVTTIAKLVKEVKDAQTINEKLAKKVDSLYQAEKSYETIKNDLNYINMALPNKADFNQFCSEISYLIYNNNLFLFSSNFGNFDLINPNPNITSLEFNISIAGNFTDIKNFLKDLENLTRLVKINSVSFTDKSEVRGAQVQADIRGEVFWLPLNKDKKK